MTRDNSRMEIPQAQFEQIEHCLPTQRGNVSLSNLTVLNAVLYVAAASGADCPSGSAVGTPFTRA